MPREAPDASSCVAPCPRAPSLVLRAEFLLTPNSQQNLAVRQWREENGAAERIGRRHEGAIFRFATTPQSNIGQRNSMQRRALFASAGSVLVLGQPTAIAQSRPPDATRATLATAPIEVTGEWHGSLTPSVLTVVSRMREASLAGVALKSDRQPEGVRVDGHASGGPCVWLHFDDRPFAWIILDVADRAWCQLAYQFGHELGHVLSNSWGRDARPANPCQWLEEALVESFMVRGPGCLAESWGRNPPWPGNTPYSGSIRRYRDDLVTKYEGYAREQNADLNLGVWFRNRRRPLEAGGGIVGPAREAVSAIRAELEANPAGIEGLGALNRWPGRSGVPLETYLRSWDQSCAELGASRRLPGWLRERLLG